LTVHRESNTVSHNRRSTKTIYGSNRTHGQRIREFRTGYGGGTGISQDALAKALGVASNTVSRWETGTYRPTIEILERLARFFGNQFSIFSPRECSCCARRKFANASNSSCRHHELASRAQEGVEFSHRARYEHSLWGKNRELISRKIEQVSLDPQWSVGMYRFPTVKPYCSPTPRAFARASCEMPVPPP